MADISVIIPAYNVEKYIGECLESVLRQSFSNFEVVCINDGSIDRTIEIIEEYAKVDNRIRVINCKKNQGQSAARNIGLREAKGKYIFFLDSDDMIISETFEELFFCAEKNRVDIIFFNMDRLYNGVIQEERNPQEFVEHQGIYDGKKMFSLFMKDNISRMVVWRQFYRKEFLEEEGILFYEGIFHEDVLFYLFSSLNAKRVMNLNKSYYIYRQREGSTMSVINEKRVCSQYIVVKEIYKYWKAHSFSLEVNQAVEKYFEKVYSSLIYYIKACERNGGFHNISYAEKSFFSLLSSSGKTLTILSEDKIKKLKKENKIVVFGAGKVSSEIIELLHRSNVKIDAVTATDTKRMGSIFWGIKVCSLQELRPQKESCLMILGVSDKYKKEVKDNLCSMGFTNLMEIDVT